MWYHDMFSEINLTLSDKPKTVRKLAKYSNAMAWRMWFGILVQRALHRYKFEGLPDSVNSRVVQQSLLWHASICFFEQSGTLMALPGASGASGVTVYGDYTDSWVYGRNGWNKQVRLFVPGEKENKLIAEAYTNVPRDAMPSGVWFRENESRAPFVDICIQFADAIADTWQKMGNARALTAKSFVVVGEEAQARTAQQLYQDYANNVPFIYLTQKIAEAQKDVIPLNHSAETLKSYFDHLLGLLATFDRLCGKRALENPDKLSGMGPSEIGAGDEVICASVDQLCDYMQKNGLDYVNEHFGTNIRVVPDGREENAVQRLDTDAGPEQVGDC